MRIYRAGSRSVRSVERVTLLRIVTDGANPGLPGAVRSVRKPGGDDVSVWICRTGRPTGDHDIIHAAATCPDKIGKAGQRSQKAGIMPGDFFSQGVAQLHLFDENAPRAESEKLMAVLDHLNAKGA